MIKSGISLFLFIILSFHQLFSQSVFRQFQKLSCPEKCWVLSHPLKAKPAMRITKNVLVVVDSVKNAGNIGKDMNGGRLDAFRHAYWMLSLTEEIGKRRALKLGKAHEKGNYREFKKHRLEDAILPDSVSCEMDLRNNAVGASLFSLGVKQSESEFAGMVIKALDGGKLWVIKKDKYGNYLFCDGTFIDTNIWNGKWDIPKCLVPSDQT